MRGIIRDHLGRILLVRSPDGGSGWSLPGGRLGPEAHSLAETLRRAVRQEAGLEIDIVSRRTIVTALGPGDPSDASAHGGQP